MYFEGPDHLSRFSILFVYCEDLNFVISVAYKIQFRSKVNQLLLELDTSSSVAFKKLLGLLTQQQQDTKGNIMDIFLLLPSCRWCVNSFLFHIFLFSFPFFFSISGCGFKISFSFSWVASLGIMVMLPLVISSFNIIGYTVGWSQCLDSISLKL